MAAIAHTGCSTDIFTLASHKTELFAPMTFALACPSTQLVPPKAFTLTCTASSEVRKPPEYMPCWPAQSTTALRQAHGRGTPGHLLQARPARPQGSDLQSTQECVWEISPCSTEGRLLIMEGAWEDRLAWLP